MLIFQAADAGVFLRAIAEKPIFEHSGRTTLKYSNEDYGVITAGNSNPYLLRQLNFGQRTYSSPDIIITQPNCINKKGSINILSPLGPGITYSIDGAVYQTGGLFANLTPGIYPVTFKDVNGMVSDVAFAEIKSPPSDCNADIFHTTETCNDFKNGTDSLRLNSLCYTVKSNKISNVTPGEFFYYAFIVARSANFTINVTQITNLSLIHI